ncbi:MAG: hypothetical protein GF344_19145 [Chitinivibrionales bacterium]|nr:hypothetical protein [Chitinivibrionales bacterium]MBD3358742.1 hypothetical protein [Chitinivibrionales bacterium]
MELLRGTHFKSPPSMLAAWTGAGNVAIQAIDFLRKRIDAQPFGHLDLSRFIIPESVLVQSGTVRFPDAPRSVFHHHYNPDLVIFESNAHVGAQADVESIRAILNVAHDFKANRIYTAAGLPQPISHSEETRVFYACSRAELAPDLERAGLSAMPDGTIAGPNGLLIGFAAARGIDAVCLLAGIPAYAADLPCPRAALSIVESLGRLGIIDVDTRELQQEALVADEAFAQIEDRIREFFSSQPEEHLPEMEEEQPSMDGEDIPKYVMDRIERLFDEVKNDRSKAPELKRVLDRWNLYDLYENRFLDLFEDNR